MTTITLRDLQTSVKDTDAFDQLSDYFTIGHSFLSLCEDMKPTRIISPNSHNYVFYQYNEDYTSVLLAILLKAPINLESG